MSDNKQRNPTTAIDSVIGSGGLLADEEAEAAMIGELAPRILAADERGETAALELHALEAMTTPTGRALKQALWIEMGWRRAYMAQGAIKRLSANSKVSGGAKA